jgi:hypothetical protein
MRDLNRLHSLRSRSRFRRFSAGTDFRHSNLQVQTGNWPGCNRFFRVCCQCGIFPCGRIQTLY